MGKLYDVVVMGDEYTDGQGNKKREYINIGAVLEGKNGPFLKLKSVPVGWDGMAGLYEPKQGNNRGNNRGGNGSSRGGGYSRGNGQGNGGGFNRGQQSTEDMDDDIPF